MAELDVYPVTLRGPLSTNRSQLVTFARVFTRDGRLYVAESRTKGRTVTVVSSYDLPEGEIQRRGGTRSAKWGDWSWSGCGCSSQWRTQNPEVLAMMADPVPEPVEPVEPEPVDFSTVTAFTYGVDDDYDAATWLVDHGAAEVVESEAGIGWTSAAGDERFTAEAGETIYLTPDGPRCDGTDGGTDGDS